MLEQRSSLCSSMLVHNTIRKPGDDTSDEDVEAPEEDKEILEEVLKLYKESKQKPRKRRAATAPGSEVRSSTLLGAGSPRTVSFAIEDSMPVDEGQKASVGGEEEGTPNTPGDGNTENGNQKNEYILVIEK